MLSLPYNVAQLGVLVQQFFISKAIIFSALRHYFLQGERRRY